MRKWTEKEFRIDAVLQRIFITKSLRVWIEFKQTYNIKKKTELEK